MADVVRVTVTELLEDFERVLDGGESQWPDGTPVEIEVTTYGEQLALELFSVAYPGVLAPIA